MPQPLDDLSAADRIGQRLRKLREQYGLSLRDVAERTELSSAYLSQLENSKAVPSLKVLQNLSDSFGRNISYFFASEPREEPILLFPHEQQIELQSQNGDRTLRILAQAEQLGIEPVLVTIEPNTAQADSSTHNGWEFVYMMKGEMQLRVGDRVLELRAGDAVCYDSTFPHKAENTGSETAMAIFVGFRR